MMHPFDCGLAIVDFRFIPNSNRRPVYLYSSNCLAWVVQNVIQSAIRYRQPAITIPYVSLEACSHCVAKA